ncbi:MAG: type II secretion system protein [Patescibacteria group bacterium]
MIQCRVQSNGFTFIEVLIVIGMLGLLSGLAIPFYQSFQVDSRLDDTAHEAAQALRRAQSMAMASDALSAFGVHFDGQQFVLFRGHAYVPGDQFNDVVDVSQPLSVTAADVVFEAVTGTAAPATVTISAAAGRSRTLTINNLGIVNVQ